MVQGRSQLVSRTGGPQGPETALDGGADGVVGHRGVLRQQRPVQIGRHHVVHARALHVCGPQQWNGIGPGEGATTQVVEMNISTLRTLKLHQHLESELSDETLSIRRPTILRNIERIGSRVRGRPHVQNVERWRRIIEDGDLVSLRKVLSSTNIDSIEMREVSPMGGIIDQDERLQILKSLSGRWRDVVLRRHARLLPGRRRHDDSASARQVARSSGGRQ